MIRRIAFQTKARTVDHLGREQIADCPTAISELWKNSFDAYARRVSLDIFSSANPVAVISDDGHGMNRLEFESRWLVVGTESKATGQATAINDRSGLRLRPRQGQKGIGRLSCANLGPVLFFISKRKEGSYVLALVDWRLFENPYLNLSDLYIPVSEVEHRDQVFPSLVELSASLSENVVGARDDERRSERLRSAWEAYDRLYYEELGEGTTTKLEPPSLSILRSATKLSFNADHLANWPVWTGECTHGTALLVSDINDDLRAQLDESAGDVSARSSRDRLFETLSSFVDPFVDYEGLEVNARDPEFSYAVRVWKDRNPRLVIGKDKQFDRHMVEPMEHTVQGTIDESGRFRGRIKSFGEWLPSTIEIEPPHDLVLSERADIGVGPFDIFIASMEFTSLNTTHSPAEFQHFRDLAERYAGFMMFRDGLRVMPYGRADNDFFEIESRRSRNAGREFWNHRQMFGRVAISRDRNPNLKDKAGREGLLDNRAAKSLKALVANILMQSARRYFGSSSDIRSELLPAIRQDNKKERAEEARSKLRKRQRQAFKADLQALTKTIPSLLAELRSLDTVHITDEESIFDAQGRLEDARASLSEYRLPGAPKSLGPLEGSYASFRSSMKEAQAIVSRTQDRFNAEIERVSPSKPGDILRRQIARSSSNLDQRLQQWRKTIDQLQRSEFTRVLELIKVRRDFFKAEAEPIVYRVERGDLSFSEGSSLVEATRKRISDENSELFLSYIDNIQSLQESIDLQHAAAYGMEELSDLRSEIERLNSLAQLGIAVEIVGHELESFDEIIKSGLDALPKELENTRAVRDIAFGREGLTDQLRFLSPLRLAGQRIQRWITGHDIEQYIGNFFKIALASNGITFCATERFLSFRLFEQQSRIFPVFINLVNNSIYWVSTKPIGPRAIILDVRGDEVFVSDSGPGVDSEDIASLFSLFFTKKARGGRGVGLYLSQANLAAGGHRIRYDSSSSDRPAAGANFAIKFRGAEFDAE